MSALQQGKESLFHRLHSWEDSIQTDPEFLPSSASHVTELAFLPLCAQPLGFTIPLLFILLCSAFPCELFPCHTLLRGAFLLLTWLMSIEFSGPVWVLTCPTRVTSFLRTSQSLVASQWNSKPSHCWKKTSHLLLWYACEMSPTSLCVEPRSLAIWGFRGKLWDFQVLGPS